MPGSLRVVEVLAAGVIVLAPSPCAASIAQLFGPGPRIDLALELDYRSRFLNDDAMLTGDAPADRVARERVDDLRVQIARVYLDRVADAMADEVVDRVPLFRALEQRYREYGNVELLAEADRTDTSGAAGLLETAPPDPRTSLRLRLNAITDGFDLAPGLHFVRGLLDCRVAYRPLTSRIEMSARRPLSERIALELVGGQSVESGSPDVHLAFTWSF